MLKTIVGVVTFVLLALFVVFVVYPFAFNVVLGLFEDNDIGTIIALGVCVLLTIPLFWLAMGLTAGAVFLTAVVQDRRSFNRDLKNRRNR